MRNLFRIWPFRKRRSRIENCSEITQDVEQMAPMNENSFGMCVNLPGIQPLGLEVTVDGAGHSRMVSISDTSDDNTDSRDTVPPIFMAIQNGDIDMLKLVLEGTPEVVNTGRYRGFSPLHAACHATNIRVLKELLQRGAKVSTMDPLGNTALHLAVGEMWQEGVAELLAYGASPDTQSEPPATVKEVRIETPLHAAIRRGDLPSTTLMLQQLPDLTLKDGDSCTLLYLAAQSRSVDIIRQLLKEKYCQEMLLTADREGNSVIHAALSKPCQLEQQSMLEETIRELLEAGADMDSLNLRGECPLYLAAKLRTPKLVEMLLSVGADPKPITHSGRSVLHAACRSGCTASLNHLLSTGKLTNLVTAADNEGLEPFHFAVQSSSIDCCELLFKNGDHLTRQDKDGVTRCSLILKHLPSAVQLLRRLFDSNVRLSNKPQYDPDFKITFNYGILLSPEKDDIQSSIISELSTTRLESLLKHPLLESFLYSKWQKIKPLFYIGVLLYIIFLLMHTSFIVMTFATNPPYNWYKNKENLQLFIVLHIVMFLLILIPDLIIMFANLKKFLRQWETLSKMIALSSAAVVVFSFLMPFESTMTDVPDNQQNGIIFSDDARNPQSLANTAQSSVTQETSDNVQMLFVKHAAAFSAFFGWVEFMMLLGRFPSLGAYVLMFTRVAKSIIKFTLAFSSLLIGFATSFMVLFHPNPVFSTFQSSIVKTLMMMIGEIDYSDLSDSKIPFISCLFLVLFLFLVCVLMANLLIGLAVNDIPDLQRQGKIKRLSKQASYLVSYEKLMVIAKTLSCFPRQLRILMTVRSKIHDEVTVYPNRKNKTEKEYQPFPSETIQEAILLGNSEGSKEDFANVEEEEEQEDIGSQFKSFKIKYSRDRRILNRRLAQLPDGATTDRILKERLDRMQQVMMNQMLQLSLKIQRSMQERQTQTLTE